MKTKTYKVAMTTMSFNPCKPFVVKVKATSKEDAARVAENSNPGFIAAYVE